MSDKVAWDYIGNEFNIPEINREKADSLTHSRLQYLIATAAPVVVTVPKLDRKGKKSCTVILAMKCLCGASHKQVPYFWHCEEEIYTLSCQACGRSYSASYDFRTIHLIGEPHEVEPDHSSILLDLTANLATAQQVATR
jgi:hypothetical protein